MDTQLFDYELPEELIADKALPRGQSRMLVLNRSTGAIEHSRVSEITRYVSPDTTAIFNDSKVIPARLFGTRPDSGGVVELLLTKEREPGLWEVLGRASKRLKPGDIIALPEGFSARIEGKEDDILLVTLPLRGTELLSYLERYGDMPLPPYILKRRGEKRSRIEDKERYQTCYAKLPGSVAAPTAGLHFNETLLKELAYHINGRLEYVTLHVGIGTFQPVKSETLETHEMHREPFFVTAETAQRLNADKKAFRRMLAVGTTTVRALESAASNGIVSAGMRETGIFIYPGYQFRFVDAILTNFHLPKSTLIMMISAFAGREQVLNAYREAVKERYRFYSYGDCMLIV